MIFIIIDCVYVDFYDYEYVLYNVLLLGLNCY